MGLWCFFRSIDKDLFHMGFMEFFKDSVFSKLPVMPYQLNGINGGLFEDPNGKILNKSSLQLKNPGSLSVKTPPLETFHHTVLMRLKI